MSEELRDRLAANCVLKRVCFQGLDREFIVPMTATGQVWQFPITYRGEGVFLLNGFQACMITVNGTQVLPAPNTYTYRVLDMNQKELKAGNFNENAVNLDRSFENLDHGVMLYNQQFLMVEFSHFVATAYTPAAVIWGIEFVFTDTDKSPPPGAV